MMEVTLADVLLARYDLCCRLVMGIDADLFRAQEAESNECNGEKGWK